MYVVQHLLAGGAAIDAIPPDTKETPLHFAVRLGNVEVRGCCAVAVLCCLLFVLLLL
jgi:hypothetical protein